MKKSILKRAAVCSFLFSVVVAMIGCKSDGAEAIEHSAGGLATQQIMDQLRWSYSHTGIREWEEEEKWILDNTPASRANAHQALLKRVQQFKGDPVQGITEQGISPDESGQRMLEIRDLAYTHAMLWMLTGESSHRRHALDIMQRFVEVIPHWPLYDRAQKKHGQDDSHYLRHAEANGLWRQWHPLDLSRALPLLRAYDILRPSLSAEENQLLRDGLFIYHKDLISKFTGLSALYHNLAGYHMIPLIQFGWVLEKPEYVHEAITYWDEMLRYSYGADGFYREVTPDYHNQISWRMTGAIPEMLLGYTDPAGYVHPVTGKRYDNLNLLESNAARLDRVKNSVRVLLMPDGTYANLNDSWPKAGPRERQPSSEPGLLGTSGVAKLGTPGMVAFLKYHGIRGHDHRDGLGLVWYAGGKEVFSDTGYHSGRDPELDFERPWSASTASHMTVAVDEQIHFTERSSVVVPVAMPRSAFASRPPDQPGSYDLEASLPAAARFCNQGKLKLWNSTSDRVQAMEADQENAYPGLTSLFRRSVIMVPLDENSGEGYLVDLFRIRGGKTHDYFLRGGLDHAYTMESDLFWEDWKDSRQQSLYKYIVPQKRAEVRQPTSVTVRYEDGLNVLSRFFVGQDTQENLELIQGEADTIRRPGKSKFAILRKTAAADQAQTETVFPWIHEVHSGESRIREVQFLKSGLDVMLLIDLGDRIDIVLSGENEQSHFEISGWTFEGTLAYGSMTSTAEEIEWTVFQGQKLVHESGREVALNRSSQSNVLQTTMQDQGDAEDSLWIEWQGEEPLSTQFHVAHVDFGKGVRQSYPVKSVEFKPDTKKLKVILEYSPGFVVEDGYSRMTQYPGWRIKGQPVVELQ